MAKAATTNPGASAIAGLLGPIALAIGMKETDEPAAVQAGVEAMAKALEEAKGLGDELKAARETIAEKNTELARAEDDLKKARTRITELEAAATKPAEGNAPVPAAKTGGLRIAARPKDGFRRCGVHHPPKPVDHKPGTFDDKQIAIMKDDPNLSVVEI